MEEKKEEQGAEKRVKSVSELWNEFSENIDKQSELNAELKEIVETLSGTSREDAAQVTTDERTDRIEELFIEMESLIGRERAAFHNIFGIDE